MYKVNFLNSREKKEIYKQLKEQFGVVEELPFAIFENNQGKLFLLSNKYGDIETKNININNMGLYFAQREREGLRLSLEGTQLIQATKNILELNKEQADLWMKGDDIPFEGHAGFIIVKLNNDILGCGMLKNNAIRNMVPKSRRLNSITETSEE